MAKRLDALPLHEEVALLALKNERGTVAGGVMYAQAAGGAILAELLLSGHLTTETVGKKIFAVAARPTPTGNEVLDECLDKVAQARRRATLTTWVQRFGGLKGLRHRVARSLVDKRVLREDEGRILFLFTRRTYPELDPSSERAIRGRIEAAIRTDTSTVDPRTSVLIAIAQHSGLLKTNFDRAHLKARKARISAIAKGEAVGEATRHAIEAVQAAVMVAVMVPAIVSH
jgi:golgi phosphoprotein 3